MNNPESAKLFIVTGGVALVVFAFLLIEDRYPGFGLPGNMVVTTDFPVRWGLVAAMASLGWGLYLRARNSK
jgi:hypothetical protein